MPPKKKSKKATPLKLVPEADRFLANVILYYMPPDDKCPLRKIRITKARERGAEWTKELIPTTTHIVRSTSSINWSLFDHISEILIWAANVIYPLANYTLTWELHRS